MGKLIIGLLLASWSISSASAQQPFVAFTGNSLRTPAGELTVRREKGAVCQPLDECSVVRLGTRQLESAWSASIGGVYPSDQAPEFIWYSAHGGGNCCLPGVAIVDVKTTPAFDLGSLFLESTLPAPTILPLSPTRFEISGHESERNKLGDPVRTSYLYDRDRRLVWTKPTPGVFDFSSYVGKYPFDLLGHPEHRTPLIKAIGEGSFKEFRDHIGVAGPMTLLSHRWLVARGCTPHSCGTSEGLFAIDIRTGRAFAMQFDLNILQSAPPRIKLWNDLEENIHYSAIWPEVNTWLKSSGSRLDIKDGKIVIVSVQGGSPIIAEPRSSTGSASSRPMSGALPTRIGPSFDCESKAAYSQPVAQIICRNEELSRSELSYVIAYHALRESLDAEKRRELAKEANDFVVALSSKCGIPKTGLLERSANFAEIECVKELLRWQREQLVQRTVGAAREEAVLDPPEALAIQSALQAKGHLPSDAKIDGVFGPLTRSAILAWQRAEGQSLTAYGSRAMLASLTGPVRVVNSEPAKASLPNSLGARREIQMIQTGSTYGVPVQINGAVTLNFVLDSGASDVSIPFDVFSTLVRAGTISKADFIGTQVYSLADGSKKTSVTFKIRSLRVGSVVLTDVTGSVAESAAPLLLGMSFLGRFQSWSVDNSRHVLVLE